MSVLVVVLSAALLLAVLGSWEEYRRGVREGESRTVGNLSEVYYKRLAHLLDLQADGGDSPAAYLRWAMEEAAREDTER